ncbi:MAG: zinc ribbon domain-containing protein, partial [Nitrospira sp.]
MPLYEYLCLDCKKRSTILILSPANQAPATCSHCASARVERILSRFASPKSEEARLEALADPDNLAGLDEKDPQSMTRFMKKMGQEMGEDLGEDFSEAM